MASLLSLGVSVASAERLFIGVLEADGYQSVLYGASAFSRVADLPLALELINNGLSDVFLLPSHACLSPTETFRVVQTVDPAQPRSADNPANVAILPLAGAPESAHGLFASAYAVRRESPPFTWYEQAKNTNLAPRVVVAIAGRHLLTATSQEALRWAWQNRSRLIDAPPQSIPGTMRVLVNPQRLADLMSARSEQAAAVFNVDKALRDFETFSFSLTLDGQAVALTAQGKARAGSSLEALLKALRPPRPNLWHGLPDDTFLATVSACDAPQAWDAFLGETTFRLPLPSCAAAPREALAGDHLVFLAPTKNKRGLCLVRIEPVRSADPVKETIGRLHTLNRAEGITLTREPARPSGDALIETYSMTFQPPAAAGQNPSRPAEPSTLFTLTTLFLKQAVFEATVTQGHLVSVLGPRGAIDEQLENLRFQEKPLTLRRTLTAQDPALGTNLCHGASLQLASLLRHIVTIMPGVKPEHLRKFPQGGDGSAFGISLGEDLALSASLRFRSGEIAALQRINKDGREVLQELVFQLFSNQMLQLQDAAKDSGGGKP